MRHLVFVRDDFVPQRAASLVRHDEVGVLPVRKEVHVLNRLSMTEDDRVGDEERQALVVGVYVHLYVDKETVAGGNLYVGKTRAGQSVHVDAERRGVSTRKENIDLHVVVVRIIDAEILRHRAYRCENRVKTDLLR